MVKYILLLFFFICCVTLCQANDSDGTYSIFYEDFEEHFPPPGWILDQTNQNHTWEKVESAANGKIVTWDQNFFTYVHGSNNEDYDESLITSKIINSYDEICFVQLELVCEPGFNIESDFDLSIDISTNYDSPNEPEWNTLASLKNDSIDARLDCNPVFGSNYLFRTNVTSNFNRSEFWIRFNYFGTVGTGLGLDHIHVYCIDKGGGGNDGNNGIDIDDDTPEEDSDNINSSDSDDKNENECNCGLSFHDPAAPLALFMVIVGFGALLFSRRRK